MRMASALPILLAVLCGAVAGGGEVYGNSSRVRRAASIHHPHRVLNEDELDSTAAWKRSHWREMQHTLRTKSSQDYAECCPSVAEMVAPKGGRTPSGLFVELYEGEENKQQLYELSCAEGVAGKPCRFVDARLYNQSICVQKYSYSYALVRHPKTTEMPQHRHRREGFAPPRGVHGGVHGAGEGWSMDYVRVRAGCECQIMKKKTAHRKRQERHRKKKNRRMNEDDET